MLRCLAHRSGRLFVPAQTHHTTLKSWGANSIPVKYSAQKQFQTSTSNCAVSRGVFRPIEEREVPVKDIGCRRSKYRTRCYIWGGTHSGALGHDYFVQPLTKKVQPRPDRLIPFKLRFSERHRVFRVACGNGFTIFAAKPDDTSVKYRVFGTGINKDSQLGLQYVRPEAPMELLTEPVPILLPESGVVEDDTEENSHLPEPPYFKSVLSVAAGRAHTIIVTPNAVYSLGNNSFGQCGRSIVEDEKYFGRELLHHVQADGLQNVVKAVCGLDHTILLTEAGEVFSCGWAADGQTGLGHYKSVGTFTKVAGDLNGERIVRLSSRGDCVLALNEKGDLFGWGNNEYGQLLGVTKEMQLHTPKHIKLNRRLKDVAAGGSSCIALDDEGQVFSWGYGVLGVGPKVTHASSPQLIPPTLFGANELSPDNRPRRLEAGLLDFAAITNNGELYTWGRNKNGSCGLGQKTAQMFPLKVNITAQVKDISMGVDHTAVITRTFC